MTMNSNIKIFISYSHQDTKYLAKDSLLGFLKGLERDNIEFWTDLEIKPGELWDRVIKTHIQTCDIALVLISQGFLDSEYCRDIEIESFLAGTKHLFPVILSPCDWKRHQWLASRQFLPGGDKTIEEHYRDKGERKRLFLTIREQLLERAQLIRDSKTPNEKSSRSTTEPKPIADFSGKTKIAFCNRLGEDWKLLADYFELTHAEQSRFTAGDEGRAIWAWLNNRGRLSELPDSLTEINRPDLVQLFMSSA
jgi:hypothetical protein